MDNVYLKQLKSDLRFAVIKHLAPGIKLAAAALTAVVLCRERCLCAGSGIYTAYSQCDYLATTESHFPAFVIPTFCRWFSSHMLPGHYTPALG